MAAFLEPIRKHIFLYPLIAGFYFSLFGLYFSISLLWVGIVLFFLGGIAVSIADRDFSWAYRHPLFLPMITLLGAMAISILLGGDYPKVGALQRVALPLSLFIFSLFFQKVPSTPKKLIPICLGLSFAVALFSLTQGLGLFHSQWVAVNRYIYKLPHDSGLYLAVGLTRHHTTFAFTIIFLFHVLLAQFLFGKQSRGRQLYLMGLFFCLLAIFFTFSRGAWISLIVSTSLVLLFWNRKYFVRTLFVFSGVFVLLYLFIPAFQQRAMSFQLGANQERLALWKVCWKMFQESPWFGQGYDSFSFKFSRFSDLHHASPTTPIDPHNMYLEFLGTSGAVGFGAFLFFLGCVLRFFFKGIRDWSWDGSHKPWFLAAFGVFIAFCLGGFFDRYFDMPHTLIPLVLITGLCTALSSKTAVAEPF